MAFWKGQNDRKHQFLSHVGSEGGDGSQKGHRGNFEGDGTVLYLDCGGIYMPLCISQNV